MGARILIVDDEEIVIKSWLRILGGGDYQIDTAYDGREALRKIEENPLRRDDLRCRDAQHGRP